MKSIDLLAGYATFQDINCDEATFDGTWACSSLLHVPARDLPGSTSEKRLNVWCLRS